MKKLRNCKWFVLGIAVCLVCVTMVVPAIAASITKKNAQLEYSGMKISLNGNAVTPKDANGNTVDPFVIDGTTYLPVRAIGNALGMGVDWDRDTNTVKLQNPVSDYAELLNSLSKLSQMIQTMQSIYDGSVFLYGKIGENSCTEEAYQNYFSTIDPYIGSNGKLEAGIKSVKAQISQIKTSDANTLNFVNQANKSCENLLAALYDIYNMRSAIYRIENGYSDGFKMFESSEKNYDENIFMIEFSINSESEKLSQEILDITK